MKMLKVFYLIKLSHFFDVIFAEMKFYPVHCLEVSSYKFYVKFLLIDNTFKYYLIEKFSKRLILLRGISKFPTNFGSKGPQSILQVRLFRNFQ